MKSNPLVLALAVVSCFVACAGVAQEDDSAQSLFKKMEDRLVNAKSLHIRVSVEEIQHIPDKPDLKREADVRMWVDGERVRIQMEEAHTQGKGIAKGKRETLSDGQEMKFLWNEAPGFIEEPWLAQKTPPDWRLSVLRGLAQYECESGFFFCQPVGKAGKTVITESFPGRIVTLKGCKGGARGEGKAGKRASEERDCLPSRPRPPARATAGEK